MQEKEGVTGGKIGVVTAGGQDVAPAVVGEEDENAGLAPVPEGVSPPERFVCLRFSYTRFTKIARGQRQPEV